MPRQIDLSQPLSADDVAYLKARHSIAYVDRMVALAGTTSEADENQPSPASEPVPEPPAPVEEETAGDTPSEDEDDLIGVTFDPNDHTEAEIRTYLGEHPEERERVLAAERDGRSRKGVLAL